MAKKDELESALEGMRQKLAIMEWDVQRDQINPAKRVKYQKLKEECLKLTENIREAQ